MSRPSRMIVVMVVMMKTLDGSDDYDLGVIHTCMGSKESSEQKKRHCFVTNMAPWMSPACQYEHTDAVRGALVVFFVW